MRVDIINVGDNMELVTFDNITDAQTFLENYRIKECIINIESGKILIWVDYIKKSKYDREPMLMRC